MYEENKALARRLFDDIWNKGNLDAFDEIYAPDIVNHTLPPGIPQGIEGNKMFTKMYLTAFPDTKMTIDLQIAEGDKVVTRWHAQGTHKGELMGIPATGKQATVTGIVIDRIAGGRIVESWGEFDQMGMMQQLGVVPTPGQ
jgi:steroid delta-isomerase-like uncharacterized protein